MTAEASIITDISPPVKLPGLVLPALHQKFTRDGTAHFREAKIPMPCEHAFRQSWRTSTRAWRERGYTVRQHEGAWLLAQWLMPVKGGYTLTKYGREQVAMLGQPQQQSLALQTPTPTLELEPLPHGLEDKLRDYQVEPARQLYRALRKGPTEWGYSGAVDFSDMGTGKTYQDLAAALATGLQVGVLCPSVGQPGWQRAFDHFGAEPLFISTYEAVRGAWRPQIATMDATGKFTWTNPRRMILILDEAQACFPAQTLISTASGDLPIGEIVEKRLKINVLSFDFERMLITEKPITNWFTNHPAPLLRIHHTYGHFDCTTDHKIWTESQGWICAKNLQTSDYLRVLQNNRDETETHAILQPQMRHIDANEPHSSRTTHTPFQQNGENCGSDENQKDQRMPMVQEFVLNDKPNTSVLLKEMCDERQIDSPRRGQNLTGRNLQSAESKWTPETNDRTQGSFIKTDAGSKSHDQLFDQGKNDKGIAGAYISSSRRQWENHPTTRDAITSTQPSNGICDSNHASGQETISESAEPLQGRFGGPDNPTRDRSGWQQPQTKEVEVLGPEENRGFRISRVDRVEVLESRSGQQFAGSEDQGALYDFEVEGTHCYFANGVLVHNCRHDDTLTVQCCSAAIRQGIPIIMASATIAISPTEFRFAGRITGLHKGDDDWPRFLREHGCVKTGGSWKWDRRSHHLERINARLFPRRGCRVRKQDLGEDCPETIIEVLPFDIPEAGRINQTWLAAQEFVDRLRQQGMPEGKIKSIERTTRMKTWHRTERALAPYVAERVRQDVRDGNSVAIFTNFTDCREEIGRMLNTRAGFYGGQNKKIRAYYEAQFQSNREFVLVSNIGAGGASVSLHDIHGERPRIAYLFPTDDPIKFSQATGRVDRVGGQSLSRQFIPCVKGTLTEQIVHRTRHKMARIDIINDGRRSSASPRF